jgi:hypothetical protein
VRFKRMLVLIAFAFAMLGISRARAQTCRWDGTAPLCSGSCNGNETEVTRLGSIPDFWVPPFVNQTPPFGANCATGTKALCCATPGRSCRWDGTAPFCDGGCHAGEEQVTPPPGSSSGAGCLTGSKVYCCRLGSTGQPLTTRNCSSGPGTCVQGYVWREAKPTDRICVTPQIREQTRIDNSQATAHRSPTGGPFGPDTCAQGFVWRDAFAGDHVCVAPPHRAEAAQDNGWANVRNARATPVLRRL